MAEQAPAALQAALPAYEVDGELGGGAFGVVYSARHTQLGGEAGVGEDEAHRDQLLIAPFRRGPMHRTPRSRVRPAT